MRITAFPLGIIDTNCYVLDHAGRALAIDPGGDPAAVVRFLEGGELSLEGILITHMHFDHIAGCAALAEATSAPVYAPSDDAYLLEMPIGDGEAFGAPRVRPFRFTAVRLGESECAGLAYRCLPTPGHTAGSVSYYFPEAGAVFVGDLIFWRSTGRTDLPGGSWEQLENSVRTRIFTLPEDTVIYPGHGGKTEVGAEMVHNSCFRRAGA